MGWMETVNGKVARSPVGRWFRLEGSGHVSRQKLAVESHHEISFAAEKESLEMDRHSVDPSTHHVVF
jgi:hypothetical protein